MTYDRSDWHSGGDFPEGLEPEAGGTHIGMFLAWAILRHLEGEFHKAESTESLAEVRARRMTGRTFLFKECDGKFWDEDLNDEGNAFAAAYYQKQYFEDYDTVVGGAVPSLYAVADTWENLEVVMKTLDARFAQWRKGGT